MPYSALAERLGKTVDAVRKIARRRGWRVSLDNRGKAIVHVPLTDLDAPSQRNDHTATPATVEPATTRPPPGRPASVQLDTAPLLAALERERDHLLSDLAAAREETADLKARLDAKQGEVDAARTEAQGARLEAVQAQARLEAAEARIMEARTVPTVRGLLGRLLG